MSNDGYSNNQHFKILNRHNDNHKRKVYGGAVTPVVMPVSRFRVI